MANNHNHHNVWRDDPYEARVTVEGEKGNRRFVLHTTAPLQNYSEPTNPRLVEESVNQSYLDSQNTLFDALYALTLDDVRRCSVSGIRDGAYNDGKELPDQPTGGFFKTGFLWDYVWTRDIAYAVDLGLGLLDPQRALNSLTFKLSQRRELGGDLQIIQDTGTGGSYPVSSDRVVWSLGARSLLRQLQGEQRGKFADLAYAALKNTIEHDRRVIFDPKDGLYRGEQSFLDWREQSYPEWTAENPEQIGMSKALSTNGGHLSALRLAASLAQEQGDSSAQQTYHQWAESLRHDIREHFYWPDQQLYATFITTTLDPEPAHQYDLLGNALAILLEIATQDQATAIISHYPHLAKGAPVIWPQQQFRKEQPFWLNRDYKPIYHNRGIWPFVTAYWLRAAKKVKHAAALTHGVHALVRGTALSLSNMENFDVVSGRVQVEEGPALNSPHQLWSVAGYLAMVHEIIFGLSWTDRGLRIDPGITQALHKTLFANSQQLILHRLTYRGHQLTIRVTLPPLSSEAGSVYSVKQVRLNGQVVNEEIDESMLTDTNDIDVDLINDNLTSLSITEVHARDYTNDYRVLYAPYPPEIENIFLNDQGKLEIHFNVNVENADELTLNVYREGKLIAENIPGDSGRWIDDDTSGEQTPSYCYSLESIYTS
ncbi:MAG: amylo-alpha-1,6-glucosidase, partial [Leptolyngbyaceae cyanobacterium]